MITVKHYFFLEGKGVEVQISRDSINKMIEELTPYLDCYCVDTGIFSNGIQQNRSKFGTFGKYKTENNGHHWEHIDFKNFPKEFKLYLYLQGITNEQNDNH